METASERADHSLRELLDSATGAEPLPGVVCALVEAGTRSSAATGLADVDLGLPRHADERFRIGSITKTFVATVALQLVTAGALRLDTTLEEALPGILPAARRPSAITLRHLLGCTSGLFNLTEDPAIWTLESPTPRMLVDLAASHDPVFAPGAGWAYCNTDYVLAGLMIEAATGRSLQTELQERIIDRLGLTGTRFPVGADEDLPEPHATHYGVLDPSAPPQDVTVFPVAWSWAAGNMISTASDLATFLDALRQGALLSSQELDAMRSAVTTHDWIPATRFGLGTIRLRSRDGAELWGMAGSLPGSTTVVFAADDGHVFAANANTDSAVADGPDPLDLLFALADTALAQR